MWIVKLALRRPYTFVVMSLLIVVLGIFSIVRMPTDIFPNIDIPVISVIWNYGGLSPEEIEKRMVTNYERMLTTVVSDVEHIESQSVTGMAVVKVFLQPGASVDAAIAQITAASQTAVRQMPQGTSPPFIIKYSATNVPILQIALESATLSEQQLFDYGTNFVRADLATIQGVQMPWPYGGKQRQIVVDIDPAKLYAWGLSPRDVNAAIGLQNVVLPTGTAKIGLNEYPISINASPELLAQLSKIPIKSLGDTTVTIGDVANVRDGSSPQTNMVHVQGRKSVLMSVLKQGSSSTLEIVARIKKALPKTMERLPKELKSTLLFDQSVFVRAAVSGVVKEGAIAASLTAIMLLVFLGSWRSTVIVLLSIPLSILVAILGLSALGQTLNVMTLGGMSLAVGILVDDATVEIENVHRNLGQKKPILQAILDGAAEIAVPALISTLCICIVFIPVAFITGAAKSLFVPLGMTVVLAMLTSYFLSRTLVPTLMHALLAKEAARHLSEEHPAPPTGGFARFIAAFERGFERFRAAYGRILAWALESRGVVVSAFALFTAASLSLMPLVGQDFFPSVDAGLIKLHVRGVPGTRIEESERHFADIQETIRSVIPSDQIETMLDNIGVPYSGLNMSLSEGINISPADGDILIALKEHHSPTPDYVRALRELLPKKYPATTFFFVAPDITTQVLNFGLPAPIDVQVRGAIGNEQENYEVAVKLAAEIAKVPGAVDVHVAQVPSQPALKINVDRTMADKLGMTERDVASDVLISLSSSSMVSPSFWLDKRGVQYMVAVQTPQYQIGSLDDLKQIPLSNGSAAPQLLSNVASIERTTSAANITHYNVGRTFDVHANTDRADLGSVAKGVEKVIAELQPQMPRGTTATLKGQVESMRSSFTGLAYGLCFAVLLVYLLLVVNFQSWLDPLVILMALPGALSGIAWILFLTGTTLSVPALMGSIMCVGVATSNSILMVTFANDQRKLGRNVRDAALGAGMTRLRPVLMTALAMILGMLPMSLGMGEGGEQNAPLGRAVVGGLAVATFSTLFFVPVMYSLLRKKPPVTAVDPLLE